MYVIAEQHIQMTDESVPVKDFSMFHDLLAIHVRAVEGAIGFPGFLPILHRNSGRVLATYATY